MTDPEHVNRGVPWIIDKRSVGPLDEVFDAVRSQIPSLTIERLSVTYPADDENVHFLGDADDYDRVQVDTGPDGQPP